MERNRMTANHFEMLLDEIHAYERCRAALERSGERRLPPRPVAGRAISSSGSFRKALLPCAPLNTARMERALAELRDLGTRSQAFAKSLGDRAAAMDQGLARERALRGIAAVAVKASASAAAGRLTAHEAATLDALIGNARARLG